MAIRFEEMQIVLSLVFPVIYTTLFAFSIAFLLITRNEKFYAKILFTFFTFSVAVWGWTNILSEFFPLIRYTTLLAQIAFAAGMFAIFIFFFISLEILNVRLKFKRFWLVYLGFIVILATNFIPGFIIDVPIIQNGDINIIEGYGIIYYFFVAVLFLVGAFILIGLAYRAGDILTKLKLRPVILSMLITSCVGVTTNLIYPSLLNDETLTPYGPLISVTLIIGLGYSIIRWNFLGIYLKKTLSQKRYKIYWEKEGLALLEKLKEVFKLIEQKLQEGNRLRVVVFPNGVITRTQVILLGPITAKILGILLGMLSNISKSFVSLKLGSETLRLWIRRSNAQGAIFTSDQIDFLHLVDQLLFYKETVEGSLTEHVKRSEGSSKANI